LVGALTFARPATCSCRLSFDRKAVLRQSRAELAAGVVQGLVKRVAVRGPALGEHVDWDVVERECDENGALLRSQDLGDRVPHSVDDLKRLRFGIGTRSPVVVQLSPAVGLQWNVAAAPRGFPNRRGSLEERELVRPRREAAVAAVGVQLAQDRDERVVCGLNGEVVEVA
jgi:hypothetical protein